MIQVVIFIATISDHITSATLEEPILFINTFLWSWNTTSGTFYLRWQTLIWTIPLHLKITWNCCQSMKEPLGKWELDSTNNRSLNWLRNHLSRTRCRLFNDGFLTCQQRDYTGSYLPVNILWKIIKEDEIGSSSTRSCVTSHSSETNWANQSR